MGDLDNLTSLNLEENQLSRKIPAELGSLSNLIYLSLSSYKLSGEIPAELGNLSNLTELYLDDNDFTSSETGGGDGSARFASVSAGYEYTCGVRDDGSVACWGDDGYGQATPRRGSSLPSAPGPDTPAE